MTTPHREEPGKSQTTVLIATSAGTGLRYFFQTGIISSLAKSGVSVVGLVPNPNDVKSDLAELPQSFLLDAIHVGNHNNNLGWLMSRVNIVVEATIQYLRMAGVSRKINRAVFRDIQKYQDCRWRGSKIWPLLPIWRLTAALLQRSRGARRIYHRLVHSRTTGFLQGDPFGEHQPSLVVTNGPGWADAEEIVIKEARARGIPSVAVLTGWDHTISQGLPLALPDRIRTWSEVQKRELVDGCDVPPNSIDVGGVASFDSYHDPKRSLSKKNYFGKIGLDETRSLVSFGCTFVGISSNVEIVRALAKAVAEDQLECPSQLLIRLHPSHFKKPRPGSYASDTQTIREIDIYRELAQNNPHIHIDTPDFSSDTIVMATSRTDMINLASILRHSDVFVTLFSTMVLEAAVNDTPVVSVAVDPPPDWKEGRIMSITDALDWPTHERIVSSGASTVAMSYSEMIEGVNNYLRNPNLHSDKRHKFAAQECTYVDGESSERIAQYIANLATSGTL